MVLSDLSIRRPVLATVMNLMIVLIGVMSFQRLSVREYPKIDAPIVSVRTVYLGASAEIIESQITQPLEDALAGIEGIRTIKSVSREQVSHVSIEFVLEREVDDAANDVRDRVARVRGRLPDEAEEPVVAKVEADAQAIIWLKLSSDRHNALEITDYADRYVIPRLQVLPGVASIIIGGERRYAMRIWLDRDRLAAFRLTPQDVEEALRRQNVEVPSGRIESLQREFTVLTESDLRTPEEFNKLIIKEVKGYPIRLKEVGYAEIGPQDERNVVRANGEPAVGLGIVKQSTANTLSVAQAVHAQIPKISLPPGMEMKVIFDTSLFVEESIRSVYYAMLEAFALVVLVIFLFLRSLRVTFIPFVTIPISLIGAFIFLYALNFSINILTLLGLLLAIGLVVDDAIVMLENIHRHLEEGLSPLQAAQRGSQEIAFAVVAMTITLAAVFVPLTFMTGNTGRLFTEFALTVSAAVLVSGFIALTLTPMMCSKILRSHEKHGFFYNVTEQGFGLLNRAYRATLNVILKVRWLMVLIFLLTAGVAIVLVIPTGLLSSQWEGYIKQLIGKDAQFPLIKSELAPLEDVGRFVGLISAPEGATLAYTDHYARQIEQIYAQLPKDEVDTYFMVVAPGLERPNPVNFAMSFIGLKPWSMRKRSQQQIVGSIMPKLLGLSGVFAFLINPPPLGQNFRQTPVQFVIQGNSYAELQQMVNQMMANMREYPGMINVDTDLKLNKPQLSVRIDRDKAANVGVEVEHIGRTLESLLGGRQVTRFKQEGKQYDVIVKLKDQDRTKPADLTAIFVRNQQGELVQLSNLVSIAEVVAPKELNRFNRLRSATLNANIAPGFTLGQALEFMDKLAKEVLTTKSAQTALDGQSREFRESSQTLLISFILALVFIYLVLSAQFESFIGPLVIMLTVPLAMTGALLALYGSGGTLNVYSQIGLVMLVGLITKHGILIVEFANQLQERGQLLQEAVIEAATLRLRPILMTTGAMVLGTLPLTRAVGAGAESRQAIGWVIVGGLLFGTLLTLFVIPTAYTLLVKSKR